MEAARRATKAAGEATEKAGDLTRATAQQSRRVRAGAANASDEARAAGANQQVVDLAQTEINKIDELKDSTLAIGNTAKGSGKATVEAVTDKATSQKYLSPSIGCFVAGTPIVMGDGTLKLIEKLRVGDEVLSRDPVGGTVAAKRVTLTTIRHKVPTLVLHLADGQAIETTANHPFFIAGATTGEHRVVPAEQLALGNSILTRAGPSLSLTRIEPTQEVKTVYNCTVEGFHTYFVGTSAENALWVHNVDCPTAISPIDPYGDDWVHMLERHTDGPLFNPDNAGLWTIPEDEIALLIEHGFPPGYRPDFQPDTENYAWTTAVEGDPVGIAINPPGPTNLFTVITRPDGSFVTAFPGQPDRRPV